MSIAFKKWPVIFLTLMGSLLMSGFFPQANAQHGHPIVGTWSGFMNRPQGQALRALFTFDFSAEQVISGALIINGRRYPVTSASLDPETWTVKIEATGQDRAGATQTYLLEAVFENLDSPVARTLSGTWQDGSNAGDFRIVMN